MSILTALSLSLSWSCCSLPYPSRLRSNHLSPVMFIIRPHPPYRRAAAL
jgi:hypothetical protein